MSFSRIIGILASVVIIGACAGPTAVDKPLAQPHLAARENPACLTETGSLIPHSAPSCAAFGHSYSNDDIRRTGSTTAGGALRNLDPSVYAR